MIIALDGPAGSGKTTTAREVASRMGFTYLDTGAMYRAVTLAALEAGVPITEEGMAALLARMRLDVRYEHGGMQVWIDGEEVSDRIRGAEVGRMVSPVAALGVVRERMVALQRRIAGEEVARGRGVVVDGRDIGTVVFPDAALKVFMSASPRVRAERRHLELAGKGDARTVDQILQEIERRDSLDSSRDIAPLRPADDAIRLDTSGLSLDEQVSFVVNKASERLGLRDV